MEMSDNYNTNERIELMNHQAGVKKVINFA